jgi:hypothetical protein
MDLQKKDLLDKISSISNVETEVKTSRKGRKVDLKVLRFDIDEDKDSELAVYAKKLINDHEITNQQVYDMYGRAEGWNMIYGLSKGSISWERLKKWCELMDFKIEIVLTKIK